MSNRGKKIEPKFEKIPFRMHPRVFAALGADLVTNDVVAVIELVKNSYDAFAENVWVRLKKDSSNRSFLEIEDDGFGMTKKIIEDIWCIVATPYRELNPIIEHKKKIRRVSGEKGLGRLSTARLGDRLHMLTQSSGAPCLEVTVNWLDISQGDDISSSFVNTREYPGKSPFKKSGTLLKIYDLKSSWKDEQITDLEDNLGRLISPFSEIDDFNIFLVNVDDGELNKVKIKSPKFLSKPPYSIKGYVDEKGNVNTTYQYSPIDRSTGRGKKISISWERVYDKIRDKTLFDYQHEHSHCGAFEFEIRVWNIDTEDRMEISKRFDYSKSLIRRAISTHKGISIYRDGILVLPKSDKARDWLGLDLRRVSKLGTRVSTSQVVGYVSISAEENPLIKDTSDRERLAAGLEVAEFEEILKAVIGTLENERDQDRVKTEIEKPMDDLFEQLSAEGLVTDVKTHSKEGVPISETITLVETFNVSLNRARKSIQERFVYYSRLATVGTIAQMLIHEIRNRTTAIGKFLKSMKKLFGPFKQKKVRDVFKRSQNGVKALEKLADTFAPLASRSFKRGKRSSVLEYQIEESLNLQEAEIKKKNIICHVPNTETLVAVDPGELDAILLNLITNAVYWMGEIPKSKRVLEFRIVPLRGGTRVRIWIHDSGPGIDKDDIEKIFWPGVTRKPGGIGMGLTVASELVAVYDGKMMAKYPGSKGGASFAFDLPLRK